MYYFKSPSRNVETAHLLSPIVRILLPSAALALLLGLPCDARLPLLLALSHKSPVSCSNLTSHGASHVSAVSEICLHPSIGQGLGPFPQSLLIL